MTSPQSHTLSKEERLCGKTTVSALISDGKWGTTPHLRFCWAAGRDTGINRLMVSVPKKFFKLQKELLTATGVDLMLAYAHPEIADSATLFAEVTDILHRIQEKL